MILYSLQFNEVFFFYLTARCNGVSKGNCDSFLAVLEPGSVACNNDSNAD